MSQVHGRRPNVVEDMGCERAACTCGWTSGPTNRPQHLDRTYRSHASFVTARAALFPTPTRLALLREVASGRVFRDGLGDDYITGGAKVNARIAELDRAGWVELDTTPGPLSAPHWALPHWILTPAGRDLLDSADQP